MPKALLLASSLIHGFFCLILATFALADDVPPSSAMGLGSAVGAGAALMWVLAKTLPDREETLRELTRTHREGLRDLSLAVDQLKSEVVSQLRQDSHRFYQQLQQPNSCEHVRRSDFPLRQ